MQPLVSCDPETPLDTRAMRHASFFASGIYTNYCFLENEGCFVIALVFSIKIWIHNKRHASSDVSHCVQRGKNIRNASGSHVGYRTKLAMISIKTIKWSHVMEAI